MANTNCGCKINCTALSIVASIILGITAAILRYTGIIIETPAFLWVALGIAVVYLALLIITSPFVSSGGFRGCICSVLTVLIAGILGTILVATVLLAIEFAATSVLGAILLGGLIGLLTLTFTTSSCLVKCVLRCENND